MYSSLFQALYYAAYALRSDVHGNATTTAGDATIVGF